MPRSARQCPGGLVYHVWNRAAGRLRLFKKRPDYLAFLRLLVEAHRRHPIRLLDFCLMPNHWHFVIYPQHDEQVTQFFRWLTHTHAMRAIAHRRTLGMGALYQGRFKTLPVQCDEHLETLLRYVLRNPIRAKLVRRVRQWRWSGLSIRRDGPDELRQPLSPWPIDEPADWEAWVDEPPGAVAGAVAARARASQPSIRIVPMDRPHRGRAVLGVDAASAWSTQEGCTSHKRDTSPLDSAAVPFRLRGWTTSALRP